MSLTLLPRAGLATDQFYINNGTVTTPPQVDAINFINNGTFDIFTTLPFDTSNTRNFTNNGTMSGSVGFRFDTAPSGTGTRKPAANFVNRLGGTVVGADSGFFVFNGNNFAQQPSYLLVSATNIINEGILGVGANGAMQLTGTNINLKRSGVEVNAISPTGSFNGLTNFQPDVAIYDTNWAQTNLTFNSASLISLPLQEIRSPVYSVQNAPGAFRPPFDQVILPFATTFFAFYTNDIDGVTITITNGPTSTTNVFVVTNVLRQAVFVGVSDPKLQLSGIGFSPSSNFQNPFQTAAILLELVSTNVVSLQNEFADLYLSDTLGSETNRGLLVNFTSGVFSPTFRPANYLLSRIPFGLGAPGNGFIFDPNFFFDSMSFTNPVVNSEYAGYLAGVDHVVSRPPDIPLGTVTNLPGRITIRADSLDMTRTRVRGEGLIDIQARHLVGSSGAFIDSQALSYTLGSTNGSLMFQNLANTNITRLQGNIKAWSGVWTNFSEVVTSLGGFGSSVTNIVQVRFHTLMVDANSLTTTLPVNVYDFITHSTNLTVNDSITVVKSLTIDAQNLTINGGIALGGLTISQTAVVEGDLENWTAANTPNLKNFTNNGSISIPNEAHFGDDLTPPYKSFVNHGTITSFGQTINSDYVEITGAHAASSTFTLITRSGKIENGRINTAGDVVFSGDVLKLDRSTVSSSSRLDLNVKSNLYDLGGASGNALSCRGGFRLLVKPANGDLLGTAIRSSAPPFAEVDHVWAGTDRGPGKAGFLNNAALGTLLLTPGEFEAQFPPLFLFAGTGVSNGLYVDVLDLSQLLDFQNELQIDPNLVIYYAAAKLGFTPPPANGVPQLPEEYLDGQFGGRLRWVKDFAGPNSSVDVVVNGTQTVQFNRALRNSKIIDSDGDGIPNFFDFTPFDVPALVLNGAMVPTNPPPSQAFRISWMAAPSTAYKVEFTTNMPLANWQPLLKYTNSALTNKTVTIWDTNVPAGVIHRFYRVGYSP